jgi:hypothetical protein
LDKRDFADVSTAKLMELETKTRAELAREFGEPRIRSEQELRNAKADRDLYTPTWAGSSTQLLLESEDDRDARKRSRTAKAEEWDKQFDIRERI